MNTHLLKTKAKDGVLKEEESRPAKAQVVLIALKKLNVMMDDGVTVFGFFSSSSIELDNNCWSWFKFSSNISL
jgi:hypothetical protein